MPKNTKTSYNYDRLHHNEKLECLKRLSSGTILGGELAVFPTDMETVIASVEGLAEVYLHCYKMCEKFPSVDHIKFGFEDASFRYTEQEYRPKLPCNC